MKTYEKYKDSGIEWIGEIPTDWNVARLRYRGKSIIGITYKPDEVSDETNGTLVLRSSNVQNGKLDFKDCVYVDKKIQESQLVKEGDILVCARNGSAHLVGKCAYIPKEWENVSFGAFMSIVRTDLDKFLFYYFNSQVFKGQKGLFATSTINQLTSNMLNNLDIPIPPTKEEQTAIATYLDLKTAEINHLIAEKKQLVKLYQEEKTALINQAITKGINPNVKLKDSGIEWLGDVPEHWEVKKIGHCVKIVRGGSPRPSGDPRYFMGDFIHWITVKEVTNAVGKYVTGSEEFLTEEGSKRSRIIEPETLLLSNSGATLGVPKISKIKGCINDGSVAFPELKTFLDRDFLYYFFESHTKIYRDEMAGNGQPNLNTEIIKSTSIPIPSTIEEQKEIVLYIEKESARIDAKIDKAEKHIYLLTEYRTALISEVVTGKIKVID